LSAFAQQTSVTVIPTPLGYAYTLPHGGTVDVIDTKITPPSYTARDAHGHITTGQIFTPFTSLPEQPPLTVPDLSSATRNSIQGFSDARQQAFDTLYGGR
jgi:hypothetical protein